MFKLLLLTLHLFQIHTKAGIFPLQLPFVAQILFLRSLFFDLLRGGAACKEQASRGLSAATFSSKEDTI